MRGFMAISRAFITLPQKGLVQTGMKFKFSSMNKMYMLKSILSSSHSIQNQLRMCTSMTGLRLANVLDSMILHSSADIAGMIMFRHRSRRCQQ